MQGAFTPSPRGYHTFTTLGQRCYIIGGRTEDQEMVRGKEMVAVYDPSSNTWLLPHNIAGPPPALRSSHRAVAYGDCIVMYGGVSEAAALPAAEAATAGGKQGHQAQRHAHSSQRLDDLQALHVQPRGKLNWTCLDPGNEALAPGTKPPGRSAHTMSLVGNELLVMCGYVRNGPAVGRYASDCWSLDLASLPWLRALRHTPAKHGAGAGAAGAALANDAASPAFASRRRAKHRHHLNLKSLLHLPAHANA